MRHEKGIEKKFKKNRRERSSTRKAIKKNISHISHIISLVQKNTKSAFRNSDYRKGVRWKKEKKHLKGSIKQNGFGQT